MAQKKSSSKVLFRFGSRAEYNALAKKDPNSLYFLLDTHELYRGAVPIGNSHYYETVLQENEAIEAAIARVMDGKYAVINDILVIKEPNGTTDLFMYTDQKVWKQLNIGIKSKDVIFPSGETLDEKLASVSGTLDLNINQKVLQLNDGVLSLKDYEKQYYQFIPEVESQGEPGKLGYIPPVPAHYELVTVDANHPWSSDLEPRVSSDGSLGWYEPNLTDVKDLQTSVTSIKQQLTDIHQINESQTADLASLTHKVNTLQSVVGTATIGQTSGTGLILRVENLETMLSKPVGLQNVYVNGTKLVRNSAWEVNIPLFSDTAAGVVPALNTAVQSLKDMNRKHTYLSADGWNDSIGDLTWNDREYATVTEYVDSRIDENIMRWGTYKKHS